MNKKLVGFAFVLILVGVLGVSLVSASWLGDFFGKITGEVAAGDEGLGVASIDDEGLWIDARQAGSYYAIHNSLIRDASGNIHMTYGSSSEPFDSMYAPDWRETAIYATDSVGYQFSSDNGST